MTDYPNWFEPYAKPNFEQFLVPLKGKDNLKFLQLGVFTGDASVWLCEHTLTGKDCWLIDVDTWEGSAEEVHESMDFDDVYATKYTTDNLLVIQNGFRTNFEYASVGLFLIYVLQIVDATVDAHLFYFDISDDLSLNIKPSIWPGRTQTYSGINLTLNLK